LTKLIGGHRPPIRLLLGSAHPASLVNSELRRMSNLSYDFYSPGQITFGWDRRSELGSIVAQHGRRAFIVSGSRTLEACGQLGALIDQVTSQGIDCEQVTTISHEPEVVDVDNLVADLVRRGAGNGDCLVAIGGGSAIDLAKAAAALVTNRESSTVKDYLEGVGAGLTIDESPIPLIAMPTTAGTGTEATKNAVISSYDPAFKKSLRSPMMIPNAVLIDPELSIGLSPETTAHTGMDAITQLLESLISNRAQPIPQALCLHGLTLAIPAIVEAVKNGSSRPAREAMAHAALLSGLALANSGLGMAHGVAAALGVHARVPHGLACAVMLPQALRINRDASGATLAQLGRVMRQCLVDSNLAGQSSREMAKAASFDSDEAATEFVIQIVEHLCERIKIPKTLTALGVSRDQIPAIVTSSRGNSMSGNPKEISDDELTTLLQAMTE
jgi:alcohol dehydrogenase